jgi:hypothetical protein
MDYETGIVGLKSRISWQALGEILHVEHHQGMKEISLSKEQLRRALQWLVKAGLVTVKTEGKYLQFLLPLADTQQSVQKKAAPRPHHPRTTEAAPLVQEVSDCFSTENTQNQPESRTTAEATEEQKAARHQISIIQKEKIDTEAAASVCDSPLSNPAPVEGRQVPLFPPMVLQGTGTLRRKKSTKKPRVSTAEIWNAYSAAYRERYGVDPVRNSMINGQLAHLVRRLGDEGPEVARYYLDQEQGLYRREGHSVGMLLKHAEHLRTLWARSRRASPNTAIRPTDVVVTL